VRLFHWSSFTSLLDGDRGCSSAAAKLLAGEGDAAVQFVQEQCLRRGDTVDVDEMQACDDFK
jgi:hypothetical protein